MGQEGDKNKDVGAKVSGVIYHQLASYQSLSCHRREAGGVRGVETSYHKL